MTAVDEGRRSPRAQRRDAALYSAACGMDLFTVTDLVREAGGASVRSAAGALMRSLVADGQVRVVSPEGAKPFVYEWVNAQHAPVRVSVAGVQARRNLTPSAPADELHVLALRAIADGHPEPADLARAALGAAS